MVSGFFCCDWGRIVTISRDQYCHFLARFEKGGLYRIWVIFHSVGLSVRSSIRIFSFLLNILRTRL